MSGITEDQTAVIIWGSIVTIAVAAIKMCTKNGLYIQTPFGVLDLNQGRAQDPDAHTNANDHGHDRTSTSDSLESSSISSLSTVSSSSSSSSSPPPSPKKKHRSHRAHHGHNTRHGR